MALTPDTLMAALALFVLYLYSHEGRACLP